MAMLVIGVTGGIGSGKSLAVQYLHKKNGVTVVDADQIARELLSSPGPALQAIGDHFGPDILQADGSLNRARLRTIIFAGGDQRRWLEQLLHPMVRESQQQQLQSCTGGPYAILVSPLLLESGHHTLVDRIVLIDVAEQIQVTRTMGRDGVSRAEAERVIEAQMSRRERLSRVDDVVDNSKTPEHLYRQLDRLHALYANQAVTL